MRETYAALAACDCAPPEHASTTFGETRSSFASTEIACSPVVQEEEWFALVYCDLPAPVAQLDLLNKTRLRAASIYIGGTAGLEAALRALKTLSA